MNSPSRHVVGFRSHVRKALIATCSSALLIAFSTGGVAAKDYYAGKTITLLVGLGPGAGGTQLARVVGKHLKSHIPGNPTVIVKNMPGAGTLKAQNFVMAKAPKDGSTVYYGPWQGLAQVIGSPGLQFKYQDVTPLGGVQLPGLFQWSVRGRIPGDDLKRIKEMERIRIGGTSLTGSRNLIAVLALDLLGTNYTFVGGYRGTGKLKAAILSKEIDMTVGAIHQYNAQIRDSVPGATALWHIPVVGQNGALVNNPLAGGVPSFMDVYKQVTGKEPAGIQWKSIGQLIKFGEDMPHALYGPGGMNPDAARAFSAAVVPALTSQAFKDEAKKRFSATLKVKSAKEAGALLSRPGEASPDVKEFLTDFLKAKGK